MTTGDVAVVLADSHPVVRSGLRALLAPIDGITVVAEATTGREAIAQSLLHRPDILVLDLRLSDINGVIVIRDVLYDAPDTGVLVFTMSDDNESVCAAIRVGARGYLLQSAEQDELARAIRGVAAGEAVFGPTIARRVAELLPAATGHTEHPFPELTARERDVLDLMAAGVRNPAIANQLNLAPKTVSNHISAILAKLRVADRAEAITRARHAGLGRAAATVYNLRPAASE
jgi:DNA-binding NarL/FixJ family response regulator